MGKNQKINAKAHSYATKRIIKKGETFNRIHATDFRAGYIQALKDIQSSTEVK